MKAKEAEIWFEDYAAGRLEEPQRSLVEAYLATAEGRRAYEEFRQVTGVLEEAHADEYAPPAELRGSIMKAVSARRQRQQARRRFKPAWDMVFAYGAGIVTLAVIVVFSLVQLRGLERLASTPVAPAKQPAAAVQGMEIAELPKLNLEPQAEQPVEQHRASESSSGRVKAGKVFLGYLGRTQGVVITRFSGQRMKPTGRVKLYEGDLVEYAGVRPCTLFFQSGLNVTLKPHTKVRLGTSKLRLGEGAVFCQVPHTQRGFEVSCPNDVSAVVHGTKFAVETTGRVSVVTVLEGRVEVRSGGRAVEVEANEQTQAQPGAGPAVPKGVAAAELLAWALPQGSKGAGPAAIATNKRAGVRGTVVDEKGRPVTGAEVRAFSENGRIVAQTTTDATGAFSLEHLAPGEVTLVALKGDKLKSVKQTAEASLPYEEVKLELYTAGNLGEPAKQLPRRSSVAGSVKDEQGVAVEGAKVLLLGPAGTLEATTNEQGRYGFGELAAGEYMLRVHKFGYDTQQAWQKVTLDGHRQVSVDFTVPKQAEVPGSIYGHVKGEATAVAGVELKAYNAQGKLVGEARADEKGLFEIDGLPPGRYNIEVSAANGETTTIKSVSVQPDRATRLDVWMKPRSH